MRLGAKRGSYLPVLTTLVNHTKGPILELGMGFCSTPYLHWACYPEKRRLVSYENNPEYYRFAETWKSDFHAVHCIDEDSWESIDISEKWTIAFVDNSPESTRKMMVEKAQHADYVVIHDANNSNNHKTQINSIRHLFKYRYKYDKANPYTAVWSNKYEVDDNFFGV